MRTMLLEDGENVCLGVTNTPVADGHLALGVNQAHKRNGRRRIHIAKHFAEFLCHRSIPSLYRNMDAGTRLFTDFSLDVFPNNTPF